MRRSSLWVSMVWAASVVGWYSFGFSSQFGSAVSTEREDVVHDTDHKRPSKYQNRSSFV